MTTANLVSTGGTAVWSSQTFPISMTGTDELFLVFRQVTGGQGGANMVSVNWVEFNGEGASVIKAPPVNGNVSGNVPATLSLTLGTPATFGAFQPGVARDYTASTTAQVVSSAGDATLSVADPSSTNTGHLVNGSFFLPQKLQVNANDGAFAPLGGSASPTNLLSFNTPVGLTSVNLGFKQSIASSDALRTGTYGKTLTFTLSTTNP